jgi:hypothetical protein
MGLFDSPPWTFIRCAFFFSMAVVCLTPLRAEAVGVDCSTGGDAFGWTVAAEGDYNGDGVPDFAVGAPCARASRALKAGRVHVFSGATGRKLASIRGAFEGDFLGSAVAFLGDVDGKPGDELVVGALGFDAPSGGVSTINAAGRIEVHSNVSGLVYSRNGTVGSENLGESLAVLSVDIDGDELNDFLVGGGGARTEGEDRGAGRVLSAADGQDLFESFGARDNDRWGSVVASGLDANNDGTPDIVIASSVSAFRGLTQVVATTTSTRGTTPTSTTVSSTTTSTVQFLAGRVRVFSGLAPHAELAVVSGREDERLGRSVSMIGDLTGDSRDDLVIGSPGVRVEGLNRAGIVSLYSADGGLLFDVTEPIPGLTGSFGTSIAVPGPLDLQPGDDFVAGAPAATASGVVKAGRVHGFSSQGGTVLWSEEGTVAGMRLGQSMASVLDYDGDEVADVFVGAPGDVFRGRRGAGTARVLSGADGRTLATFNGRRGLETRLFFGAVRAGRRAHVAGFQIGGGKRELGVNPLRGDSVSQPSMAVLNATGSQDPGTATVVIGGGPGASGARLEVYRAGRRRSRLSRFVGGESGYVGGLNVAAGRLDGNDDDGVGDEIAAVEADGDGDGVHVSLWRKLVADPLGRISWARLRAFRVFGPADLIDGLAVEAAGAHVAVGNITSTTGDELVFGPVSGLPAVRVFSRTGTLLNEWVVYPPDGTAGKPNSGAAVAVGDLNGDGQNEIVTAPSAGQLWIQAWNRDGDLFELSGKPVSFFVTSFDERTVQGLRVALADVDFDGRDEILVTPGVGGEGRVEAYEGDGTKVVGWQEFRPFGARYTSGVAMATTDNFLRQ